MRTSPSVQNSMLLALRTGSRNFAELMGIAGTGIQASRHGCLALLVLALLTQTLVSGAFLIAKDQHIKTAQGEYSRMVLLGTLCL